MEQEKLDQQLELISSLLGELTMRMSALEAVLIAKGTVTEQDLLGSFTACMIKFQSELMRAAQKGEPDSISDSER